MPPFFHITPQSNSFDWTFLLISRQETLTFLHFNHSKASAFVIFFFSISINFFLASICPSQIFLKYPASDRCLSISHICLLTSNAAPILFQLLNQLRLLNHCVTLGYIQDVYTSADDILRHRFVKPFHALHNESKLVGLRIPLD